ncbi:TetR family transcriptional regulator (plasmid) [Streptomyces sp. NBC_01591]|nr:TetR family transcriptional regulator [Streptomyces sp. NBC_01591]
MAANGQGGVADGASVPGSAAGAHAKVDEIAEQAELTRGAVYSNFPGKTRSLSGGAGRHGRACRHG